MVIDLQSSLNSLKLVFLICIFNDFQLPRSLDSTVQCEVIAGKIKFEENQPIGISSFFIGEQVTFESRPSNVLKFVPQFIPNGASYFLRNGLGIVLPYMIRFHQHKMQSSLFSTRSEFQIYDSYQRHLLHLKEDGCAGERSP